MEKMFVLCPHQLGNQETAGPGGGLGWQIDFVIHLSMNLCGTNCNDSFLSFAQVTHFKVALLNGAVINIDSVPVLYDLQREASSIRLISFH